MAKPKKSVSAKKTTKKSAAKKSAPKKSAAKKSAAKKSAPKKSAAKKSAPARKPAARKPSWVPAGTQQLVTNLIYADAAAAIDWYVKVLGAREIMRMLGPDGKQMWHAEIRIGDTVLFLSDQSPMASTVAPHGPKTTTASLQLFVPDTDAAVQVAVAAGAELRMPAGDMFWGDRMAAIVDPFGHTWMIATRTKVMSEDEMREAGIAFAKAMAQGQS